jgi:lysyl-tRNA synthetase class 2
MEFRFWCARANPLKKPIIPLFVGGATHVMATKADERHFWLRAECKAHERRTILLPEHCAQLVRAGHRVTVERSDARCIADERYAEVDGVQMAACGSWPCAPGDAIVLGLKNLPERPYLLDHEHVMFAHCFKEQDGWRDTLDRFASGAGRLWDLEFLRDPADGNRRVCAFGWSAGYAGMAIAVQAWAQQRLDSTLGALHPVDTYEQLVRETKEMLDNAPGALPATPTVSVIAPRGRCGRGALQCAHDLGIPDAGVKRYDREEVGGGGPCMGMLERDIVVNCIYLSPEIKHPFVTGEDLDNTRVIGGTSVFYDQTADTMRRRRLSVLGDVSCDPDSTLNPFPFYDKATDFDRPVLRVRAGGDGKCALMDVVAIDHLPAMVPLQSSREFADALLPHLLEFSRGPVWGVARATYDEQVKQLHVRHGDDDMHVLRRCAAIDTERVRAPESFYPHKFFAGTTVRQFIANFSYISVDTDVSSLGTDHLAGRIARKSKSGAKLHFYDLSADGRKVQLMCHSASFDGGQAAMDRADALVRRGDVVGVCGTPTRTKAGELSVLVQSMQVLAPCLRMLPDAHKGGALTADVRYRNRHLDLIVNPAAVRVFETRAAIIGTLRAALDERGFLEVETSMLHAVCGGAAAKPFVTHHNDLGVDFYLRVAPELELKKLIVGGMHRVYEIGKNFRNECADLTHNPEFTACEFYWAFADYHDLMEITEQLLARIVRTVNGNDSLRVETETGTIDFTPPFRRVSIVDGLRERGVLLPSVFEGEEARSALDAECARLEVECGEPRTTPRLLDKLVERYLEPECTNPTFLMDHPQVMSPLAKWHRRDAQLTERFELFVGGRELCNAYTELNEPRHQRRQFELQAGDHAAGDDEAQLIDENFCTALEYGLPPTAGWGMGIDRLVMLLTGKTAIRDVILFPAVKAAPPPLVPTPPIGTVSVLVLGSGLSTPVLIRTLLEQRDDQRVTVATDQPAQAEAQCAMLSPAARARIQVVPLAVQPDEAPTRDLINIIGEHSVVASMLPPHLHAAVATACAHTGRPLITASYVTPNLRAIVAENAKIVVLAEMGLDPGIDGMLAAREVRRALDAGERVTRLESYCGALPVQEVAAQNPLAYKFSWHPIGAFRALRRDACYRRDLKETRLSSYVGLTKEIPFNCPPCFRFLAYPNGDALAYAAACGVPDVSVAFRGTLRYEGFLRVAEAMRKIGLLEDFPWKSPAKDNADLTALAVVTRAVKEYGCGGSDDSDVKDVIPACLRSVGCATHPQDVMNALDELGLFDDTVPIAPSEATTPLSAVCAVLQRRLHYEAGERDMVVLQVRVGTVDGAGDQAQHHITLVEVEDDRGTALARTVGLTMAAGVRLLVDGDLPAGLHLPTDHTVYSRVLPQLERDGLRFRCTMHS